MADGVSTRRRPVSEVMTDEPVALSESATILEAAQRMRESDIGDVVIVSGDGQVRGVLTDRDIVVRGIADQLDYMQTTVAEIYSANPVTIDVGADAEEAAGLMRQQAVRRLPVVDHGQLVGVVSLGDLAIELDVGPVVADISQAPPTS